MDIKRPGAQAGSQPSSKGPAGYYMHTVRIDPLSVQKIPQGHRARVSLLSPAHVCMANASVGPDPGIVTAGCGPIQRWVDPVEEIRPGDVVWISLGETRWHGATATMAMTHIVIQEGLDGKIVNWM